MLGLHRFGFLVVLLGGISCTPALAIPAPGNITSTTPALSLEMFKRAVSAPYVFTAFTSASESNLYVYTSNDATNFNLLKGPAYTPPTGLIRDPSVILHTEYVDMPVLICCIYLELINIIVSGKYYIACAWFLC
jgi:hypothetical protein